MHDQTIRGTDWMRREEEVAKLRHDRLEPHLWDFGIGEGVRGIIPAEHLPHTVADMVDLVPDGLTIVNRDGVRVYVYKDSKKMRAEVGLRADAVALWGEKTVKSMDMDTQIFGAS